MKSVKRSKDSIVLEGNTLAIVSNKGVVVERMTCEPSTHVNCHGSEMWETSKGCYHKEYYYLVSRY